MSFPAPSNHDDESEHETQNQSQPTLTSSDRIRELSAIDADIASLLRNAGLAFRSLTSPPELASAPTTKDAADDERPQTPLDAAKAAFSTHNTAYLHTLQAIQARLRRQAYALEEAGIIASDAALREAAAAAEPATKTKAELEAEAEAQAQGKVLKDVVRREVMPITNGGLGKFDVGWLNSRKDDVGKRKEAELWREMRTLVEGMVERERKTGGRATGPGQDDMDVGKGGEDDGGAEDVYDDGNDEAMET